MCKHDGHITGTRDRSYVVCYVDGEDQLMIKVGLHLRHPKVIQEETVRDKSVL
jgi:hypothetical protein